MVSSNPRASAPPVSHDATDGSALQRKARLGAITLAARTIVLETIVFGGNLILARVLDPEDFGVMAISQFALAFFVSFGDAGLGGGLVQRKEHPSQVMLSSIFWLQIAISIAIMAAVWVSTPILPVLWPDLPRGSAWLLRALSVELLLTAARTIPSILMERELYFGRLSVLEVTSQLAYFVVALPMGVKGYGVTALVGGVLARAVTGVILAYALRPWRPDLTMDRAGLRPIVNFGIPYQLKNVVGFANNAVTPLYAGHVLGAYAVGIITFAQQTAYTPLKLVQVMARVGFPLYSRLQDKPKLLAETLGRSAHVCAAGTLLFSGLMFGLGPEIVRVAYPKWGEAIVPLYLFAGTITVGFLTPLVAAAFDAMGRPKVFLRLSLAWTLMAWVVVPFTTPRWGVIGFVGGYIVHTIVFSVVVLVLVGKVFPEAHLVRRSRGVLIAALAEAALARYVIAPVVSGPFTLMFALVAAIATFVAVMYVVDRRSLLDALSLMRARGTEAEVSPVP
ncbi:MAG TPA: oligosaccharide flippase family protein [Polyangiaceae bacterium]|jgi:PST family polysaccharide transporter|nr:oligosaccharide flippase family protein [Polyangiaceae bacterium]